MDAYADRPAAKPLTHEPLTHRETLLIVLGVLLPTFMGSLDQTILATALPTIGRDFGEVHDLPWLITAYLLASTAVIPLYGPNFPKADTGGSLHGGKFKSRTIAWKLGSPDRPLKCPGINPMLPSAA